MKAELGESVATDSPAAMVKLHVVIPTEQDPPIDIGAPVICRPLVDVVRLAVGRGAVAAPPAASAVTDRKRDPLARGEQTLLSADVEWVAPAVDEDLLLARLAETLLDGCGRERGEIVLGVL